MMGRSTRNILRAFACISIIIGLLFNTLVLSGHDTVYAAPVTQTGGGTGGTADPTTADTTDKTTACAVEKIGWFVCPVIEQAGKIADKSFEVLANNFLRVEPELASDKSGTRQAWEIARNIANIMFIISFLVIIISQVTNMGINNYGIKKMLPRLVIAAIAVNVSYYICQLAVDVTNILGYEIQNAMTGISNNLGPSVFGSVSQYGVTTKSNGAWGNMMEYLVVAALATAGVVWLLMGPMIAVIMMAVITVITIIVILLLRKALIVLLIVVSPIAFVMYLLPNTEKFFSKWMSMFGKLLMVFPVVAMLFGAGQLASTIILVAGNQSGDQAQVAADCNPDVKEQKDNFKDNQNPNDGNICGGPSIVVHGTKDGKEGDCNGGQGAGCQQTVGVMMGLIAMGIAVAPLIAVWSVLKGALAAAGTIGGKVSSSITKGGGGLIKGAEKRDQLRQNRMYNNAVENNGGGLVGMRYRRRAKKENIFAGTERQLNAAKAKYNVDEMTGDEKYLEKVAGGSLLRSASKSATDRALAQAEGAQKAAEADEIKNLYAEADKKGWTSDDWKQLAMGRAAQGMQGGIAQKAAIMKAGQETDVDTLKDAMVEAFRTGNKESGRVIAETINSNFSAVKSKAAYMTDNSFLNGLRSGSMADPSAPGGQRNMQAGDINAAAQRAMGAMGEQLLSTQKKSSLQLYDAEIAAHPTAAGSVAAKATAHNLQTDPRYGSHYAGMGADGKAVISGW